MKLAAKVAALSILLAGSSGYALAQTCVAGVQSSMHTIQTTINSGSQRLERRVDNVFMCTPLFQYGTSFVPTGSGNGTVGRVSYCATEPVPGAPSSQTLVANFRPGNSQGVTAPPSQRNAEITFSPDGRGTFCSFACLPSN